MSVDKLFRTSALASALLVLAPGGHAAALYSHVNAYAYGDMDPPSAKNLYGESALQQSISSQGQGIYAPWGNPVGPYSNLANASGFADYGALTATAAVAQQGTAQYTRAESHAYFVDDFQLLVPDHNGLVRLHYSVVVDGFAEASFTPSGQVAQAYANDLEARADWYLDARVGDVQGLRVSSGDHISASGEWSAPQWGGLPGYGVFNAWVDVYSGQMLAVVMSLHAYTFASLFEGESFGSLDTRTYWGGISSVTAPDGTPLEFSALSYYTGIDYEQSFAPSVAAVPEPATLALVLAGFAAIGLSRHGRSRLVGRH